MGVSENGYISIPLLLSILVVRIFMIDQILGGDLFSDKTQIRYKGKFMSNWACNWGYDRDIVGFMACAN